MRLVNSLTDRCSGGPFGAEGVALMTFKTFPPIRWKELN